MHDLSSEVQSRLVRKGSIFIRPADTVTKKKKTRQTFRHTSPEIEAETFKESAKAELFISGTHPTLLLGRLMVSSAVIRPSFLVENEAQKCDYFQLYVRHGETQRLVSG